ncbi:uncharacterized protein LOC141622832 [Silene latifolia]|uniref:uncharacterized protein LOC141622832 n=1 Tax=Silene latifolia TaxID=37657 RepID=UPI003D76D82D
MAETPSFLTHKRYAVVTGSNKGLGLEISRHLASQGVVVQLTSRDQKRGLEAIEQLKNSGVNSENLEYHQLDVTDPPSFAALTDFIKAKFGKLDILVNNAGVNGVIVNFTALLEEIRTVCRYESEKEREQEHDRYFVPSSDDKVVRTDHRAEINFLSPSSFLSAIHLDYDTPIIEHALPKLSSCLTLQSHILLSKLTRCGIFGLNLHSILSPKVMVDEDDDTVSWCSIIALGYD